MFVCYDKQVKPVNLSIPAKLQLDTVLGKRKPLLPDPDEMRLIIRHQSCEALAQAWLVVYRDPKKYFDLYLSAP